jgi:methylglutaconyl-CoA hydratase
MIETRIQDTIVLITLNRPEKRNALNNELLLLLRDAIRKAAQHSNIRLLVLKGNGNVFCAGVDLDFLKQLKQNSLAGEFANLLSSVLEDIRSFPVPVLAKVQGACMGGANGIIAAADIVLADINTRFAFSEVKLGLVPAIISPYVLNKMPLSRAFDLMLTGRTFDATEAMYSGLITFTGDERALDLQFAQILQQILSAAPLAIMSTRKLLWEYVLENRWNNYLKLSHQLFINMASSEEALEGINAFFEKRYPNWMDGINKNLVS